MTHAQQKVTIPRWLKPMNTAIVALQRVGLSLGGMHVLTVVGRRSGKPRTTPISVMTWKGQRYVVGGFPGADWVANARAAGAGTLASGKRKEHVRLVELTTDEARPVLRDFPTEVPSGVPMMAKAGVVHSGTPEEFEALAGRCPVFRIDATWPEDTCICKTPVGQ